MKSIKWQMSLGEEMNLYLIESPFQLLQAYELIDEETKRDDFFILRLNNLEPNNAQLKELVNIFNLNNVFFINTNKKLYVLFYILPFILLSFFSRKLIVGDDSSVFFRVVKVFTKKRKVIFLDDGVATLSKKKSQKYNRFTIFKSVYGDKNSLRKCRGILDKNDAEKENVNIIIGSKLVEENICTRECYFFILNKIKHNLDENGYRIIYVPHRGESEKNLLKIEENFSFSIYKNRLPIELIGYESNFMPVTVNSIMSTALYSMSLIYNNSDFNVYPIDRDDILSRREAILDLYSTMKRSASFNFCEYKDF